MEKNNMRIYKKYEPYSAEWERAANNAARSFAPDIYPCKVCGAPVVKGYCCNNCGSNNPSDPNDK